MSGYVPTTFDLKDFLLEYLGRLYSGLTHRSLSLEKTMAENEVMPQPKEVVLTSPIRVFARLDRPKGLRLGRLSFKLAEGSILLLGEPRLMVYDHRDLDARQMLNVPGEFFVLQEELDGSTVPAVPPVVDARSFLDPG